MVDHQARIYKGIFPYRHLWEKRLRQQIAGKKRNHLICSQLPRNLSQILTSNYCKDLELNIVLGLPVKKVATGLIQNIVADLSAKTYPHSQAFRSRYIYPFSQVFRSLQIYPENQAFRSRYIYTESHAVFTTIHLSRQPSDTIV